MTTRRRRSAAAVGVAVAAFVVLVAGCAVTAVVALDTFVGDGVRVDCRTASAALLDRMAADPVLTADVPGTEVTAQRRANPCDPGEESPASVTVVRALTPGAAPVAVRARYEELLTTNGWTLAGAGEVLCGTRAVEDRTIAFRLRPGAPPQSVEATIWFFGFRRDTSC
ncbi:hypothetical protein ACFO1B_41155 [Dactylosporangium siamense]|uniref:Lipoprotein n=1 Tax=Dactylosporangium siamense TaxID=685454 RepID=A0A919PI66_9ACTN|nr:hypothetical protein [Dactylosporangium siamense]GIG42668.1 hypothetical protein Dsi01nite_007090 [Dactylosporangium siamense]